MTVEQKDQLSDTPLELENSTLEEIVDALLAGSPIALPQNAGLFVLDSEDARAAFRFYASRTELWPQQKPLSSAEVDQLLQALEQPLQIVRRAQPVAPKINRPRWRITRVRVHRFAGLHRHCGPNGESPDILSLDLDRDITCIWGFNGAGKSALQSAIMWCLTGQALRSQHKPAAVHMPIALEMMGESENDDLLSSASASTLSLPPIVPLPSADDLAALQDKPACDTWVELTLREHSGTEIVVKRELKRGPRGAISTQCTGIEYLGLPQWAIEAGTLMPAIAATMRFDEKTTFADAIAQLTGLRPLKDLGKRSERLVQRLLVDESDKAVSDAEAAYNRYTASILTFEESWSSQTEALGVVPNLSYPSQESEEESCRAAIESAVSHLETLRQRGQKDIDAILAASLSLETKGQVAALENVLRDARERLGSLTIATLPSVETLKRLGEIQDADREAVLAKLQELQKRAIEQVARQQKKEEAARWQLYAMVSQWHRRHHPEMGLGDCPVCGSDLSEVPPDALLDKGVAEALQISAQAHNDATKTLLEWQKDAAAELLEALPASLRLFVDTKAPATLLGLYRNAYVNELLQDAAFNTQLRPLKQNAAAVWDLAVQANPIPLLPDVEIVELPVELRNTPLATRFANLQTALSLSLHRQLSADQIKQISQRYFGAGTFDRASASQGQVEIAAAPLRHQVMALEQAVTSAEPIISLLRQLREIEAIRQTWERARRRHQLLQRAAAAVQQFTRLPSLVSQQVEGLIRLLDERTTGWLNVIYRPHYVGGPGYIGLDPSRAHGIGIYAGYGGLRVPANEVMNSSHLRACVWAFVFSLWERIRDRAGALEILQLDDPQTYFDPINTENLAAVIPKLVEAGMAPIITSNDNRFIAAIKSRLPKLSTGSPSWTMLQVSPISSSRRTVALTPAVEEVIERRTVWREDEANVGKTQEFVERVRLHIENRLWDLLAADPMLLHKPTLADLINHISSARNHGERPFNEVPFERLLDCQALRFGSEFYRVINKAHHNLRDVTPFEAKIVDESFDEVDRLLRSCSASYARFMGRLSREDEDLFFATPPAAPAAIVMHQQPIQVLGDFSARTYSDALAIEAERTTFSFDSLGDIALFAIRGASLGALALPGQIVAVSLSSEARSGDPVIALHGTSVLARRYHVDQSDTSKLTLACDQSGSERVAPALTLPRSKVRILPIVGVLYDSVSRAGGQEARSVESCSVLDRQLLAARIIEDSGYPVVRSGDLVLLEQMDLPSGATLDRMKGDMVAFVASQRGEQFAYLKRVGSSIQGSSLRIFENVGTFGDSLAVSCSGGDSSAADHLEMQSMWRVHGVIRKS
ncbi:AAA family ATPase [Pseudomonas aeruginosa]|uniref:ATP-binding protein n=1 Tax=Pseudomonas aeruginosa TaxID=287 RepID=UPI0009A36702|nr:AAA family ATPase [Pseudomonas aeruginosa]MBA5621879.1 AAA family ATPase [Pseudomonas aeruginosa]MBY9118999.1 AAA family ATPase [Pseudomonas aeruginosa]MCV3834697.1 AAA family ATPase [Pseudomonas aeruginosa]MCV3900420.1 AAA family ATPase [Pseudomonas aeruginosa]MCV3915558.1 AAA family ATPase [Pseudomonas aeruginosa]